MAWTTMHFAVGMGCSGAAAAAVCFTFKRGWRWIPPVMTLGGIWALAPDLPRILREDFPSLPLASTLGAHSFEYNLHAIGNLFFFHNALDAQPRELALHGLAIILLLYNIAIAMLWYLEHKQRNSIANRAYQAHSEIMAQAPIRVRKSKRKHSHRHHQNKHHSTKSPPNPDVIHRITPDDQSDTA